MPPLSCSVFNRYAGHHCRRQTSGAPGFMVGLRLSQGKVNDFDYQWPQGQTTARTWFSMPALAEVDDLHFASEGRDYQHGLSPGVTIEST